MSPGALIVFDELINYPTYAQHEILALREMQSRIGRAVRILGTPAHAILQSQSEIEAAIKARGGAETPNMGPYRQDALIEIL